MWILVVYLHIFSGESPHTITMQEFDSQLTCQVAGTKIWEFTSRKALWTCVKK